MRTWQDATKALTPPKVQITPMKVKSPNWYRLKLALLAIGALTLVLYFI